jgi:hypothetical protein
MQAADISTLNDVIGCGSEVTDAQLTDLLSLRSQGAHCDAKEKSAYRRENTRRHHLAGQTQESIIKSLKLSGNHMYHFL